MLKLNAMSQATICQHSEHYKAYIQAARNVDRWMLATAMRCSKIRTQAHL